MSRIRIQGSKTPGILTHQTLGMQPLLVDDAVPRIVPDKCNMRYSVASVGEQSQHNDLALAGSIMSYQRTQLHPTCTICLSVGDPRFRLEEK